MNELDALLLSDGRPGHFHLAEGILEAVGRLRPVRITRLDIDRGRWPGRLLALASNAGHGHARLLQIIYGISPADLPAAKLVVSAGAQTLAANVACTRLLGASNIFYGSLRAFRPHSFDLVLTSYSRQASRPRHAMALKPSSTAAKVREARPRDLANPPRIAALLIGGDSGECRFGAADWDRLIAFIADSAALHGTRWRVSNSRRTPDSTSDRLAALSTDGGSVVDSFIDVRKRGSGTLANLLGGCDAAVVTDDSSSMISEVVAAGLPALGVSPARQTLTANERDYRQHMSSRGWYRSVPIASLTTARLVQELAAITPLMTDPLDDLAALIKQRLPALFPPI